MRYMVTSLLILFVVVSQIESERHSLYYIYTALSKPVSVPGIHEFTAMGLLDDREIDYYNSQDKVKIPKRHWMKERLQADYWEKGTQSRKSKEQWFKVNVNILMDRMRHNQSDVHVLQWRHGCEAETHSDGSVRFVRGVDQYSYDGSDFLSFDDATMQWVAPVDQAVPTKRKWDDVPILNQYTKGYLEKECVDWLSKFMTYGKEELKTHSPPEVFAFAKKSKTSDQLSLTCMATGFYPKEITMFIRKNRIRLPDTASESVVPNGDGTYQLRKSVEISASEKADYDCYVHHMALDKPIVVTWDGKCNNCEGERTIGGIIGGGIGALLTLALVGVIFFVLLRKGKIRFPTPRGSREDVSKHSSDSLASKDKLSSHSSDSGNASTSSAERAPMIKREQTMVAMTTCPVDENGALQVNTPLVNSAESNGQVSSDSSDSGQGSSDDSPTSSNESIA